MSSTTRKQRLPTHVAKVSYLATDDLIVPDTSDTEAVDTRILDRIRKCLERANHPNTPEAEAKAALRMSSRLMAQYNVTQAEVLAAADTSERLTQLGGRSIVQIVPSKENGRVTNQIWVKAVVSTITTLFDCKSFSTTRRSSIEWTFYGIVANTAAAAMSFEMAHNLVQDWALLMKGISTRNSYCLGVARGLRRTASDEKKREEEETRRKEQLDVAMRVRQEEEMRSSQLRRLEVAVEAQPELISDIGLLDKDEVIPLVSTGSSPSSQLLMHDGFFEDEMDHGDDDLVKDEDELITNFKEEEEEPLDPFDDFENQLRSVLKHQKDDSEDSSDEYRIKQNLSSEPSPATSNVDMATHLNDDDDQQLSVWSSTSALTLFRQKSQDIADEYLRSQDVKLRHRRRRKGVVRDSDAYRQGKKDSKKIDLKRRRIEFGVQD